MILALLTHQSQRIIADHTIALDCNQEFVCLCRRAQPYQAVVGLLTKQNRGCIGHVANLHPASVDLPLKKRRHSLPSLQTADFLVTE
jgi:hypothetical protein